MHDVWMSRAGTPAGPRLNELDALRGLAAAGVVAYHALALSPPSRDVLWAMFCSPLFLLVTARPFVILFFVLSGYVLHMAILAERERSGRVDAAAFALRRLCRIGLPFAAAGALAALMLALCGRFGALETAPAPMRGWAELAAGGSPLAPFAGLLTLDGLGRDMMLNSVAWSLVYELRITLFMPTISWAVARNGPAALGVATAAGLAAFLALQRLAAAAFEPSIAALDFQTFDTLAESLIATLYYVPMFVLGAVVAETLRRSSPGLDRLSPAKAAAGAAGALFLMWYPNDAAVALGAALSVALVAQAPALRAAALRPTPAFLGRISFSLYLTHLPILYGFVLILGGPLGVGGALACGLAAALPAAWAFWAAVERPSQRLSRRFCADRLAPSRRSGAVAPAE